MQCCMFTGEIQIYLTKIIDWSEVNILWVPLRFVSGENHIIAQENLVLRFMETVIISRIRLTKQA